MDYMCCFELYFPIDRLKLSLQSGYARRNQLFAKTNRQTGSLETTQLNSVNSSSRLHVLLLFIQFLLHSFQNLLVLPIKLTKKASSDASLIYPIKSNFLSFPGYWFLVWTWGLIVHCLQEFHFLVNKPNLMDICIDSMMIANASSYKTKKYWISPSLKLKQKCLTTVFIMLFVKYFHFKNIQSLELNVLTWRSVGAGQLLEPLKEPQHSWVDLVFFNTQKMQLWLVMKLYI